MKQQAKIKNWSIEKYPYGHVLVGNIFDHPRQKEFRGEVQVTTELFNIDFVNRTAETRNTLYTLEDSDDKN